MSPWGSLRTYESFIYFEGELELHTLSGGHLLRIGTVYQLFIVMHINIYRHMYISIKYHQWIIHCSSAYVVIYHLLGRVRKVSEGSFKANQISKIRITGNNNKIMIFWYAVCWNIYNIYQWPGVGKAVAKPAGMWFLHDSLSSLMSMCRKRRIMSWLYFHVIYNCQIWQKSVIYLVYVALWWIIWEEDGNCQKPLIGSHSQFEWGRNMIYPRHHYSSTSQMIDVIFYDSIQWPRVTTKYNKRINFSSVSHVFIWSCSPLCLKRSSHITVLSKVLTRHIFVKVDLAFNAFE